MVKPRPAGPGTGKRVVFVQASQIEELHKLYFVIENNEGRAGWDFDDQRLSRVLAQASGVDLHDVEKYLPVLRSASGNHQSRDLTAHRNAVLMAQYCRESGYSERNRAEAEQVIAHVSRYEARIDNAAKRYPAATHSHEGVHGMAHHHDAAPQYYGDTRRPDAPGYHHPQQSGAAQARFGTERFPYAPQYPSQPKPYANGQHAHYPYPGVNHPAYPQVSAAASRHPQPMQYPGPYHHGYVSGGQPAYPHASMPQNYPASGRGRTR